MFKKLTEVYQRNLTRPIYVNMSRVVAIHAVDTGSRIRFTHVAGEAIDVVEKPGQIIDDAVLPLVITDREDTDAGNGNEDGRISNPA